MSPINRPGAVLQPNASRQWTPVLTGFSAHAAMDCVHHVAENCLAPGRLERLPANVASGWAGVALLFGYLDLVEPGCGWARHAEHWIVRAVESASKEASVPGLFRGRAGIAWALEHVHLRIDLGRDEDLNAGLDEVLGEHLACSAWAEDFGLANGLVGYGVYALSRVNRPGGKRLLEEVISRLDELKVSQPEGFTWLSPSDEAAGSLEYLISNGRLSLGLAHGVPGVVALLSHAYAAGVAREKVLPLIEGAVSWLLAQKSELDIEYGFPRSMAVGSSVCERSSLDSSLSQLAWTCGDLGIALALAAAARATAHESWWFEALELARKAASSPSLVSGATDAGLCHGAAGNGHLFNRLYQASGHEAFAKASKTCFYQSLEMYLHRGGLSGFNSWNPERGQNPDPWNDEPSLLEGAVGVALALLSATHPVEPDWDQILLASVPARRASTTSPS